jgi:hypothetical protein
MRLPTRLPVLAFALFVAACGSGGAAGASQSASPSPSPTGLDVPSAAPNDLSYWLRATFTQAIPPVNRFAVQPWVVITGDGRVITQGPVPAIFPGPLAPNLRSRQISDPGRAAILAAAKELGLLDGNGDFTAGGPTLAGGVNGRLELTIDGRVIVLTGNPSAFIECVAAPCVPPPGSAAAFGELWRRLGDLGSWIPSELGPDTAYVPESYALLVGQAPTPDPNLPQAPAVWPLSQPLALFGGPVANGTARCGTVSGADAATLGAALAKANALTPWVQNPATSATFGLTVRPMVAGEDVCREIFGPA